MLANIDIPALSPRSIPVFLVLGVAAFVILFIVQRIVQAVFDPLRDVPGPFVTRFTSLWLLRQCQANTWDRSNVALHKKYGRVVRVAPGQYSIQDGEANKTIYGHGNQFPKSIWYKPWSQKNKDNLFNTRDTQWHSQQRRKFTSAYTMSALISYEPHIDQCNKLLRVRLDDAADSGKTIDVQRYTQCYAFDVIAMMTFSQRLGSLDRCEDELGLMGDLHMGNQLFSLIALYPPVGRLLDALVNYRPKSFDFIINSTEERIQQVKADDKGADQSAPADFVQKLLRAAGDESGRVSTLEVHAATSHNMAAGSDTTGVALSAIVLFLLRNPRVMAKLRAELADATAQGNAADPISFAEASRLPYLQAVIKESMRLHPSVGFGLPRVVPPQGATICDRFFPAGTKTVVGVNAMVTHRDTALWGADAAEFVPERWIERRVPADIHFMTGSRTCLGKNISMLELSKLVPELVRHYDFTPATPTAGNKIETRFFAKFMDLECRVSRRTEKA